MIKAELINSMGNDITVVDSARVSFDKKSNLSEHGLVSKKDVRLIRYLAEHNHFTPFTHPQVTLRETVPIFVARQRFKHVIGFSYNEVSRRYVSDIPEFFTPDEWRNAPNGSIKQGSGAKHKNTIMYSAQYSEYLESAKKLYEAMVNDRVAPEQARMVLPMSMLTSYYVTGSLAAFARLVNLRKDSHAQKEIQLLAAEIDKIIRPLFPVSWDALIN